MTDRFVPVFDGKLPDDPDAVPVMIATEANIDAMWGKGDFETAFDLLLQSIGGKMLEQLWKVGVKFDDPAADRPLAERLHTRDDWSAFYRQAAEFCALNPGDAIRQATAGLSWVGGLQQAYDNMPATARRAYVGAVLMAVGAAQAANAANLDLRKQIPSADSIQSKGGEARTAQRLWWENEGLKRCQEKRAADPAIKTAALIVALRKLFAPLLAQEREDRPKGMRDLPLTDAGWRKAIERWEADGRLPAKTR